MRKAAAFLFVLLCGLTSSAFTEGILGHKELHGFALADLREKPGVPLKRSAETVLPTIDAALDGQAIGAVAAGWTVPEIPACSIDKDAVAPLSLSVFLGRGNGDIFCSLHERYAWRPKFKATNLGAGISRDIRLSKAIRIRPYVGVIRSHALLRPSDLHGNGPSLECRLTAFCIGVPLFLDFH